MFYANVVINGVIVRENIAVNIIHEYYSSGNAAIDIRRMIETSGYFAHYHGYNVEFRVDIRNSTNVADMVLSSSTGYTVRQLNPRILGFTDDFSHADFVNVLHDLYAHNSGLIASLKAYRVKKGMVVDRED